MQNLFSVVRIHSAPKKVVKQVNETLDKSLNCNRCGKQNLDNVSDVVNSKTSGQQKAAFVGGEEDYSERRSVAGKVEVDLNTVVYQWSSRTRKRFPLLYM